jgi:coproporphyrinogen III oxidase-like Fe-S oxidoreductase
LGVPHISIYDLETDNDSRIGHALSDFKLSDEDTAADNILQSWNRLARSGFKQYEISNFSKDTHYSKHNLDFWRGKDYIGFGLGAVSRFGQKILINTDDFNKYLVSAPCQHSMEILTKRELSNLLLALTLRLDSNFRDKIYDMNKAEKIIKTLEDQGHISDFRLTTSGKLLYNQIVSRLIQ